MGVLYKIVSMSQDLGDYLKISRKDKSIDYSFLQYIDDELIAEIKKAYDSGKTVEDCMRDIVFKRLLELCNDQQTESFSQFDYKEKLMVADHYYHERSCFKVDIAKSVEDVWNQKTTGFGMG